MKLLLTIALLSTSLFVFAEDEKGKNFDEKKAKALQSVDEKISKLNELKSCISGASDKKALKECRKAHKSFMKERRRMRKEKRKARKEKRNN